VRDLPSTNASSSQAPTVSSPPIPVRHLLLSGFLLHILLPLLSRLIPLITTSADNRAIPPPTAPDLQRILQMSLVLSTQAKYSSLFPLRDANDNSRRDEEIRNHVESLGKAARWRSSAGESPQTRSVQRQSLQRGPSMNQGRHRRRGWRASTKSGQQWGVGQDAARLNSESVQAPEQQWGRPGVDDEDDDDTSTPGQSYAYPRTGESSYATMTTGSTLTAGAMGGESLASYGESQRTPQAEFGMRRPNRSESSGSSEVNLSTVVPARR